MTTFNRKTQHVPVLLQEALNILKPEPGQTFLDATLGGGGHALAILKTLGNQGTYIALDQDFNAIKRFVDLIEQQGFVFIKADKEIQTFAKDKLKVTLIQGNFRNLNKFLEKLSLNCCQGILADLGLSTDQFLDTQKGFSFLHNSQLDMRIDKSLQVTAKDLLNGLYKQELVNLFRKLADIRFANKLAHEIVKTRKQLPITATKQLTAIIQKIVPNKLRQGAYKNPEAKVFQALRIAVNDEINALREFLPQAFAALCPKGKLAVVSFHSGEDRVVKNYFKAQVNSNKARYLVNFLQPGAREIQVNPRSASAKLRAIEKI